MKYLLSLFLLGLISCGEETITQNTVSEKFSTTELKSFSVSTCSQRTFAKPPVDILYVIDNSGSTLNSAFDNIKGQIQNTIYTLSSDFDYHIYVVPLNAVTGDEINTYPLLANNPSSIPNLSNVTLVQPENLQMFSQAGGNNNEFGINRAYNVIQNNRDNGIFREEAHTIVVMISTGDDTYSKQTVGGGNVGPRDEVKFNEQVEQFKSLTEIYADANPSLSNPLRAQTLRFFSVTAASACHSDWKAGTNYRELSQRIYSYQNLQDNKTAKDRMDLCSGDYSSLFAPVNNSIKAVVIAHKYDHWKISSANESQIQANDITVVKLKQNGEQVEIREDSVDGFEYLGYKSNINTRYEPSEGEPVTGLVVKLNGNARVSYPDCIVAKTRTPTEYFGFITIPREPDLSTVEIKINGELVPQNAQNGWTYVGWRETINIKVPGPTDAAVTPPVNQSGYVIQLHGNAIYTNGDTIGVYYKPQGK